MAWSTGDLHQRLEVVREDQRAQVQISEEAVARAAAVMRHCQDCIEQDAEEINRLLDELPRCADS